ncbi:MAG: helix-turn-helix domain-containing protein [Dehalococcoidia bacterium]
MQEAVLASGLRGTRKLVAVCLARYASDEGGSCRPAQETLADDAGVSLRTVRDVLGELEALGFAQVIARGTNGRATRYRLHADALPERTKQPRGRRATPLLEDGHPAESAGDNRQYLQPHPAEPARVTGNSCRSNRQNLPPIRSSDPVRDPVRGSSQVHTPRARARDPITRAIQEARRRFEVVALDGDAGDLEASVLAEHLTAGDVARAEQLTLERGNPASWEFLRWWLREFAAARRDGRPLPEPRARGAPAPASRIIGGHPLAGMTNAEIAQRNAQMREWAARQGEGGGGP